MNIINRDLKRRIIDISYKHNLSHLGSCLTAVDIIDEIFSIGDLHNRHFVLSSGHAGLAYYVVLEKYTFKNAEDIFNHHGVHPDRCRDCGIFASSGSLGHGIGIAVGMALANRNKNIYCLVSDGECSEGSVWEALRIADEQKLTNLYVYINCNRWGAYKEITYENLNETMFKYLGLNKVQFRETTSNYMPFLKEQDAHYYSMTEADYKQALEILND